MTRRTTRVLKLAAAGAGFAYLLSAGRLSSAPLREVFGDPKTLVGMAAIQVLLLLLGVWRWWLLLKAIDHRPHSYPSLLAFNWMGQFFGCFAPSAFTTDAARIGYVRRSGEATTTAVVTSLVVDRLCGIAGACILAAALAGSAFVRVMHGSVFAWLFAAMLAAVVVVRTATNPSPRSARLRTRLAPVAEGIRSAASLKASAVAALCISVVAHALKVVCLWPAVRHMPGASPALSEMFSFAPIGFLAEALPLGPGGFGTAHLAFEYLFGLEGIRGGAALFNVYFTIRFLVSGVGG